MEKVNRSNNIITFKRDLSLFPFLFLIVGFLIGCDSKPFESDSWVVKMPETGFSSSPRLVDLNGDDVMDFVIGGSGPEFVATDFGVIAIDGKNGKILWKVPSRNQIFGSPIFNDINNDGTEDVFIGGRSAVFYAINGKNGKVIWEYLPNNDTLNLIEDRSLLNFYNPQWIHDINDDNINDILVSFGGYVKAAALERNRPAGRIMILSGSDGKVLRDKAVPDGMETYMSPILYQSDSSAQQSVLFGTGGETIGGGFYKASLDALIENDSIQARALVKDSLKGFIAPPVILDVNNDNVLDFIICSVQGAIMCFNGKNDQLLWENNQLNNFEVYATPCPGFFVGDDDTPDFFLSMGFSPKSNKRFSVQVLIDGKNGQIVKKDTLGLFSYASPVSYNFNDKKKEQVLLSVNEFGPIPNSGFSTPFFTNRLVVYDPAKDKYNNIRQATIGTNLGATPLITDLDNDGWIDIIYGYMADGEDFYSYQNGVIERLELRVKYNENARWFEYMGLEGKGIF